MRISVFGVLMAFCLRLHMAFTDTNSGKVEDFACMGVCFCSLPSTCSQLSGVQIKESKGSPLRNAARQTGSFVPFPQLPLRKTQR